MSASSSHALRGVLIMLFAVASFATMDAGMKLLTPHYPPVQIAALRGMASLPFVCVWIAATTGFGTLRRVRFGLQLLRGALGVVMLSGFAYGVRTLPLATAYTLFFIAPMLITALSGPVLGEQVGRGRWIAILLGLCGTLVVLRPTGEGMASFAGFAVLIAAAGYAVAVLVVRVLSRTDSTQSSVFWWLALMSLGAGVLAAPDWVPIRSEHALLIAGVGLFGALGQYAITVAFTRAEASVIAPFEYSALAWGLLYDGLLWHQLPDRWTWIGAAIIVAAGLYLLRHEARPKPVVPP